MESKKYDKLVTKTKKQTHRQNKPVIPSGEREGESGNTRAGEKSLLRDYTNIK